MDDVAAIQRKVLGTAPTPALTVLSQVGSRFVFGVWDRPGLPLADRRLIVLTCAGIVGQSGPIDAHIYAALESGDLSLAEIQEFVLHFAVFCSWPRAQVLDGSLRSQWERLQVARGADTEWPGPSGPGPSPEPAGLESAVQSCAEIMGIEAGTPSGAFPTVGAMSFAFGEVWRRPGLTRRQRRIVSITACAAGGWSLPLRNHLRAALVTGDLDALELDEFVLQLAPYAGFPAATELQMSVDEVTEAVNASGRHSHR